MNEHDKELIIANDIFELLSEADSTDQNRLDLFQNLQNKKNYTYGVLYSL